MSDKPDRRSARSRRALIDALFHLLQEQDWQEISVQLICDRADVARSTFYAHYQTRQDLLDDVFAAGEAEASEAADGGGLGATLCWLADHLQGSVALQRRLQGTAAGQVIVQRFRKQVRHRFAAALRDEGLRTDDLTVDFVTGGTFARLESWLTAGCPVPIPVICDDLARLIRQIATA